MAAEQGAISRHKVLYRGFAWIATIRAE